MPSTPAIAPLRLNLLPCLVGLLALLALPPAMEAQISEREYARAEQFLSWNAQNLVYGATVSPNWMEGDRFWYRNRIRPGHEFVLVDAAAGTRSRAFDHERMAASLSVAADTALTPWQLPFQTIAWEGAGQTLRFSFSGQEWRCTISTYDCRPSTPSVRPNTTGIASPDASKVAFIREHDLWVQDLESGEEIRLSFDGEEEYGYATDSQGWRSTDRPVLLWSPDSRSIATYRLDERGVQEMVLWETAVPRPILHQWKYALPGDSIVPMLERVVFHLDDAGSGPVRLEVERDHQRTSSCCGLTRGQDWADVEWSAGASRLAFVSTSRDYKEVKLRLADPRSGAVRTLHEEVSPTFFETNIGSGGVPNWRIIQDGGEFLWFSQRDGWGHLYRYDAQTGALLNRVTSGAWNVLDLLHVDEAGGWLYFTGVGREANRDPYYRHLYRVRLDGSQLTLLTPEDADHQIQASPSGRYFLDSYSTVSTAPVTVLRAPDGRVLQTVEAADISDLLATGYPFPDPFVAKARDGATDIHGLMYRPSTFDPDASYPVINYIYPGPQSGSVTSRSFSAGPRGEAQALAELGFIVVQIDGLGAPLRSKAFHTAWYADMGDNGQADQVAGMKQLAQRHPSMDLTRVGIYGHSGGGFASTGALFRYPDFFKVAVSGAGNHDNRGYTYYWGERYQGLLEDFDDGTDSYTSQANHLFAGELRGKLLITYGTLDSNVHPNMTLLVVDELIRHNQDFDLLVFPNRDHGYASEPYNLRRSWDYFVRHLMGQEPPPRYRIRPR
ncbi:MAG: DPP IV N-terminal domain-containing protein [Gemmatimonadota bacterium]